MPLYFTLLSILALSFHILFFHPSVYISSGILVSEEIILQTCKQRLFVPLGPAVAFKIITQRLQINFKCLTDEVMFITN